MSRWQKATQAPPRVGYYPDEGQRMEGSGGGRGQLVENTRAGSLARDVTATRAASGPGRATFRLRRHLIMNLC